MTELDHVDYRLPTTVVPSRYDLRLEPDLDNATFSGEETVTVEVREPVTEIVLNAAELRIESAAMEDASGAVVEGSVTLDEPAERPSLRTGWRQWRGRRRRRPCSCCGRTHGGDRSEFP